jgi:hypothetical protein
MFVYGTGDIPGDGGEMIDHSGGPLRDEIELLQDLVELGAIHREHERVVMALL